MTVRTDMVVDWSLSPRLILIEAPSTSITAQDLVDTCRHLEALVYPPNLDDAQLIKAAGKAALGGGQSTTITATLQNAKLIFEERTTALDTGTITTGDTDGKILTDSTATFVTSDDVYTGCTIYNGTTVAFATVTEVISETQLRHRQLSGGTNDEWTFDDAYIIYPNEQCAIEGGNVVAIDANGDEMSPVLQSPNVQIVRSSASSGTAVSQSSIVYSSFQNSVWINPVSGIESPTLHPGSTDGNREFPVKYLTDAVMIANEKGFTTLQILDNMTLDNGTDITGFEIIGKSHVHTEITMDTNALCSDVTIRNCNLDGVLDGGTHIANCMVGDVTYVNGHIHDSGMYGVVTLDGNEDAVLAGCFQVDTRTVPEINVNGTGQDLMVTDWSGSVLVSNSTSTNSIQVQIDGGNVELDSTITAGDIKLSGVGTYDDNSTSLTSLNIDGLMNKALIATAVSQSFENVVFIDTVNGTSGTGSLIGTEKTPSNNIADTLTIAEREGIHIIHVTGSLTLSGGVDVSGYTIKAYRSHLNSVTVTDAITSPTYFTDLTVGGTMSGGVRYTTCVLGAINEFDGGAKNCLITNAIDVVGAGANYFTDCDVYITDGDAYKPIAVHDKLVNIINCEGNWEITDKTGANTINIAMKSGKIKIASSCVAGRVDIAGIVSVDDQSAAGCDVRDELALSGEAGIRFAMADNGSTVTMICWLEVDGQRIITSTEATAAIKGSDGATVVDLGTNDVPTTDGTFSFTFASSLAEKTAYYIAVSIMDGTRLCYGNKGFATG